MKDRWQKHVTEKEMAIHNVNDGKPFPLSAANSPREFRTGDFVNSKSPSMKTYSSSDFSGTDKYSGKDKGFTAGESSLTDKTMAAGSDEKYGSKKYAEDQTYAGTKKNSNAEKQPIAANKTTSVPGATSQSKLDAQGQVLHDKITKKELTVDEVRELLNKDHDVR
ncbi:MAG: hypothetical protein ABI443_03420 [Chthoniobacterales bacterium]